MLLSNGWPSGPGSSAFGTPTCAASSSALQMNRVNLTVLCGEAYSPELQEQLCEFIFATHLPAAAASEISCSRRVDRPATRMMACDAERRRGSCWRGAFMLEQLEYFCEARKT